MARIDSHRTEHHPALAVPPQADGNANVGASAQGGAGAGVLGGAGPSAHGGAGANPQAGDDTEGFAPALLPAKQVEALLAVPRPELRKILDSAGVPHAPATVDADLHIKYAAVAWAAEKRRSIADVRTLDDGLRDRMPNVFAVPAA